MKRGLENIKSQGVGVDIGKGTETGTETEEMRNLTRKKIIKMAA
jgi:hypothetical protein